MATVERVDRIVNSPDELVTITTGETVELAAAKMRDNKVGCLVVLDRGKEIVGILTERDIISRVVSQSADPASTTAEQIMTTKVVFCTGKTTVEQAQQLMVEHNIRHLPIVEDNLPVGMISSRDIVAYQLRASRAMKAAAERVARLTKGLKCLDLEELIDLTTHQVPKIFQARWAVLCFPENICPALDLPLTRREHCPCSSNDLLAREDVNNAHQDSQVVFGNVPGSCERLGGKSPKVVIPLTIDKLTIDNTSAKTKSMPKSRRGYLCMCQLPPDILDGYDLLSYTSGLLGDVLSANLTNATIYQEARYRNEVDTLTGANTRWLLETKLDVEYARALRYGHPFSVAMMDIDHFKRINDTWGHTVGDQILHQLAQVMRSEARATDVFARYGGDEFVLLMPETDLTEATRVLDRLRNCAKSVSTPDDQQVTLSCGLADRSGSSEDTATDVLRRADAALCEAKRAGRNRTVAHSVVHSGP